MVLSISPGGRPGRFIATPAPVMRASTTPPALSDLDLTHCLLRPSELIACFNVVIAVDPLVCFRLPIGAPLRVDPGTMCALTARHGPTLRTLGLGSLVMSERTFTDALAPCDGLVEVGI